MSLGGGADTVLIRTAVDPSGATAGLEKVAKSAKATGDQVEKTFSSQSTGILGKFGSAVDGIGTKIGGLTSKLTASPIAKGILQGVGLGAGVAAITAVGTAMQDVVAALGDMIQKYEEQQVLNAQTNAVLESTGRAANVTAKDIDALSHSLQQKTATDDNTIQSGANLILTFTRIRNEAGKGNDIFNQTVAIAVDMSRALGQDMKSSAIQLGKALNDPIKGLTALQRVGVTFTADQKAQIKGFMAANDQMDAQKVILAELTTEFGNSGAKFAATAEGQRALVEEKWADIQKTIGSGLEWLKGIATGIFGGVVDVVGKLIDGIGNLGTAFNNLHRLISPDTALAQDLRAELIKLADAHGEDASAILDWADAQAKAEKASKALAIQQAYTADANAGATRTWDQYAAQFGVSAQDVQDAIGAMAVTTDAATDSSTHNATALEQATALYNRYTLATNLAAAGQKMVALVNALATQKQDDYNAALDAYHHRNDYLIKGTSEATAQLREQTSALKGISHAMADSYQAYGKYSAVAGSAFRHVAGTSREMSALTITAFDVLKGGVSGALKQADADAKSGIKQLWYDIKHPGELANNRDALKREMERAQKALHAAEKTGDANVIAEAEAFVASLNAKWAELNGTITINARIDTYNQSRHPLLQGGRASGGPIWPGEWNMGEGGPERVRINRDGTGYVWPHSGSERVGASVVRHEFGTLNVKVQGDLSPAAAHELGRGIGLGFEEVLAGASRTAHLTYNEPRR